MVFERVKNKFLREDQRSKVAYKNIAMSFGNKFFAILISLAIVPLTINYLDTEQYGIWLTISSIVSWLSFFDVGLGHGFRNKFAEAKAVGDVTLARKYLSTTYISLIVIFGAVLLIFELINPFINWSSFLKVSSEYGPLLKSVVSIVLVGVCCQFVVNIFTIMLAADQRTAASSIVTTIGQAFALLAIFILTKQASHSMNYLAYALTWVPVLVILTVSVFAFTWKYREYRPSIRMFDKAKVRNIMTLGVKFFVIQISMILIFQVVNIILSRELGPEAVTEYNVCYKYFSVTLMVNNIILSPFWPAFTDAYVKRDYPWMKTVHSRLTKVWLLLFVTSIIMLIASPWAFRLWLGNSVIIPFSTRLCMFLYVNIVSYSAMNMILINGTGKLMIQTVVYVFCALISIPLCICLSKLIGIPGVLIVLSLVYGIQALLANIQIAKIIKNKAVGIWNK